jgi:glyoxalase family protein
VTLPLLGLHHVSALSAHIGATNRFYTRVLGMRPVIKTVNQDDPSMYHLFFSDGAGSPGSDMTVFDMPHAAREHQGSKSITLTTFRVCGEDALEYWADRLVVNGVAVGQPAMRDGRCVLDFADPVGTQLSLIDDGGAGESFSWAESPVDAERQIRGLGYIVLTVSDLAPTDRFLTEALGLQPAHTYVLASSPRHRVHVYLIGDGGPNAEVHVIVRDDLPVARYGSGGVHHVALRIPDGAAMPEWVDRFNTLGYHNSGIVDRHYFTSLYVREPNHVLFELATDGPGFEVDGPIDPNRLSLPPFLEPRRNEIEAKLRPIEE